MNKLWRWIIVAAVVVAAFGTVLLKQSLEEGQIEPEEGDPQAAVVEPVAGLPTLVDLGAGTCIPCKMMTPILAELQRDYRGTVNVVVIDVNEQREETMKYGIRVIPTQVFLDGAGKELYRHEGFMSKEEIIAKFVEFGMAK